MNGSPARLNTVIGGHFRLEVAKELGLQTVPVVYLDIPDAKKEKELNLRLNKNVGEFDIDKLASFDEAFLRDIGFSSPELDSIFALDETPETFDLEKELKKLEIGEVTMKKGDLWQLGESKLLVGDSTVPEDMAYLMGDEKADLCLTDPPYRLSYMKGGIRHGKPAEGFGAKRNRKYLETDTLPDDFTELWMANVKEAAKPDFSIICYEAWHNVREIWGEMEKHWKVKNMIIWHLADRHQGYAGRSKFFSKYDLALAGASGEVPFNYDDEGEGLQEEYETALFAISGKPHWENYQKGGAYCPTDFIEHKADDLKSSGQGIIFGTKPLPILIPYIKVLTKRGDLVLEPFGGSGSTLIAATKMKRVCRIMEKSPVYAEVIRKRWEKLTGEKGTLIGNRHGTEGPEASQG